MTASLDTFEPPRYGREDLPKQARTFFRRLRDRRPGLFWGLVGITALVVALFLTSAFWFPALIVKDPTKQELAQLPDTAARLKALNDAQTTRNGVRGNLLQGIGGLLILGTFFVGILTIRTNRRGQDTDRFTKSIDQLGEEKVEVRLGGIYALQQIAELPRYRRPIAEIFAAYLRAQTGPESRNRLRDESSAQSSPRGPRGATGDASSPLLRADLQAVLRVLIVDGLWDASTTEPLDLSYVSVPRANLRGAKIQNSILLGANLAEANLSEAQLQNSDLRDADLTMAILDKANLSGAILTGTSLRGAELSNASLTGAQLVRTTLPGAHLSSATMTTLDAAGADLTGCILNAADLSGARLLGASLAGSSLVYAHLNGADLGDALLAGADVENAQLDPARLDGTELAEGADALMKGRKAVLKSLGLTAGNEIERGGMRVAATKVPRPAGAPRAAREPDTAAVVALFRTGSPSERVFALWLLEDTAPEEAVESAVEAIANPRSGFEQYHGLILAERLVTTLDDAQAARLIALVKAVTEGKQLMAPFPDARRLAIRIVQREA
jgi:uncharacterized protein YjbI with pentapeptide repeats